VARIKGKGKCDGCGRQGVRIAGWSDLDLCATCTNIASNTKNHRRSVDLIYKRLYGGVPQVGEVHGSAGDTVDEFNLEVIADINDALGGGYKPQELAATVKKLVENEKHGAQVAAGDASPCDPHQCQDLQDAINELLRVHKALGEYSNAATKPGELADVIAGLVADLVHLRDMEVKTAQVDTSRGYEVPKGYQSLATIMMMAMDQAAKGKGHDRHATEEPFDRQPSMMIGRWLGLGYPLGQAVKKIVESKRLGDHEALAELLGAIVYTAMACRLLWERIKGQEGQQMDSYQGTALAPQFAEGCGHD
jgi:hypothetical protein